MSLNIDHTSANKRKLLLTVGAFCVGVVFVASSSVVMNGIQSSRLPEVDKVADNAARTQAAPKVVADPMIEEEIVEEASENQMVGTPSEGSVEIESDRLDEEVVSEESVRNDDPVISETDPSASDANTLEPAPANKAYQSLREQSEAGSLPEGNNSEETNDIGTEKIDSTENVPDLNPSEPKRLHPVKADKPPATETTEPEIQDPESDKSPETQTEPN